MVAALVATITHLAPAAAAESDETSRGVPIPEFYHPPASLPPGDGDLVRSEPLPLAISLPSLDGRTLPGTATRLMYKSTDATGEPVPVTGAYLEPAAEWRGEGPRPLVAVAPGTMGQGDQCAASMGLEQPLRINGDTVSVGYEDIVIYRLLAAGAAVVVTDYTGLGTTDRLHTYVNRVDGGHALLDAVRAARALPGTSLAPESRVGLYGYSQGGGASASAAELQPDYAPDVPLAGAYVGAPPADLAEVLAGADGSALTGALGWTVNGLLQQNPHLREVADRHLGADGRAALQDLGTMCVGDALAGYGFQDSSQWTRSGLPLESIVDGEPLMQEALDEQRIGRGKPATPVRVVTGAHDDIVPHAQTRRLAADWCAQGADVSYVELDLPPLGDGILTNHLAPLLTDQGPAVSWLTERLSGHPTEPTC
ncbi:lipase family protein [Saccharopolyspora montiporae]|uniref:lipase family protein n=1 Tax=Saccharopolyspora montiporae TaxID=2781240 RepID=UPI00351C5F29